MAGIEDGRSRGADPLPHSVREIQKFWFLSFPSPGCFSHFPCWS